MRNGDGLLGVANNGLSRRGQRPPRQRQRANPHYGYRKPKVIRQCEVSPSPVVALRQIIALGNDRRARIILAGAGIACDVDLRPLIEGGSLRARLSSRRAAVSRNRTTIANLVGTSADGHFTRVSNHRPTARRAASEPRAGLSGDRQPYDGRRTFPARCASLRC